MFYWIALPLLKTAQGVSKMGILVFLLGGIWICVHGLSEMSTVSSALCTYWLQRVTNVTNGGKLAPWLKKKMLYICFLSLFFRRNVGGFGVLDFLRCFFYANLYRGCNGGFWAVGRQKIPLAPIVSLTIFF